MKRIYPYLLLLASGLSAGVFFYVGQFPVMRFYAQTPIALFGHVRLFPILFRQLGLAVGGLAALWLGYSFWLAKRTGKPFALVLRIDALSYLPLSLLGLAAISVPYALVKQAVTLLQLGHWIFWAVVLAGIAYLKIRQYATLAAGTRGRGRMGRSEDHLRPTRKQVAAIFLASLCIYLMVGIRLFERLPLGGDEPHYLLISHSLLHDGDLAIKNNYQQEDYRAFFPGELQSHVSLGKDQTRYPGHPIGLSVLLLPFYALGGRLGALVFINLSAALLVTQLYLLAFAVTQSRKLSLLLWALSSFTAPLWIYSSQIYPEVLSACLLAMAFRLILYPLPLKGRQVFTHGQLLAIGVALGLLPWIQQRMILPATLLMCAYIVKSGIFSQVGALKFRAIAWVRLVPLMMFASSGLLLAGYYYALYGNPMPGAPYRSIGMPTVFSWEIFFKQGMLGLWLDQEAGLFMVAPHYLLIVPGFIGLLRRNWREALGIALLILSIAVACGGFVLQWYGAWSPAARYMVALTPLLLPLVGEALRRLRSLGFKVATAFLIMLSAGWSYIFFQTPTQSLMQGIGINAVLELYRTPIVDPSLYFPSFVMRSNLQYAVTAVWVIMILGFAVWYVRAAHRALPGTSDVLPIFGSLSSLRRLFGIYGMGFLVVVILTGITAYIPAHERAMNGAKNKHVREFLCHLDRAAILAGSLPVEDSTVRFEYVRRPKRGLVDQHDPHFIVSGPREFFPAGHYTAIFSISASDVSITEPVVILDIAADRGNRIFVERPLPGTEFSQAGAPMEFQISFELLEDEDDLETRVFFLDRADVQVESVTIRPDFVDFYYRAGMQKLWNGDRNTALALFSDVARAGGQHARLLYQLGVLFQERGQWGRSVEFLQRAVKAAPDWADAPYRLGLAVQQIGNWQLAEEYLEQATRLLPTHLDAWITLLTAHEPLQLPELPPEARAAVERLSAWQFPYSVNFANQIEFLGYRAEAADVGTARMHYYWRALTPMLDDYVIFVHFADRDTTFQQDHEPQRRVSDTEEQLPYPTSHWQVGEVIHEQFDLQAPSGTFTVTLGIWDPQGSGKRLPIVTPVSLSEHLRRQFRLQESIAIP